MKRVYLDHIAATPLHPLVLEAMLPYLKDNFGNPQSLHSIGQEASIAVEEARESVAQLIHANPEEIYLTSSGSESNNFALKGLAIAQRDRGTHIVVSAIEHQSVLHSVKNLEKYGFTHSLVPVDKWGMVNPDEVRKAITQETILVSIMLANSEVGTVEPIREIAEICRSHEVFFHTDAVAAVGNIPVDVSELGVDALSLAGNQFYGPKGSAALFLKKGTRILPFIDGGIQEGGRRAGTEDVAGIVGLGIAAKIAEREMGSRAGKIEPLRDKLIELLPQKVEHVILTGHPEKRLPYHASFCVEFIEGEAMLLNLDMQGIAVSSGSACTSKALKASHVLLAMDIDHALAQGSLVFSLIDETTSEDIDYFLEVFPPIIERLRKMSPLYTKYLEEKDK
ncbi:MAG: aminotransferase class V-fold PLP-dependent enzyme [Candidatus Aminicenantes bacterium]|nr:MAG: aminotransferase class V-fold PLP-dependent enzyme [Candidatus Aminicenantes bacterium]